ncbi:Camk protein kinase, partial [Globisporangium splendens]
MDVWHAVNQYKQRQGVPAYEQYVHPPISDRARPYAMHVPSAFLPWDQRSGIIALRRKDKELAVCRCGVVLAGIYFQLEHATYSQVPVALKVMDRTQLQLQRDDVENEVRVMSLLQICGVEAPLSNPYVIRWEHGQDAHNVYLATEYIANGSLQVYAHKKIRHLMVKHLQAFVDKNGEGPTKLECVSYVYRDAGHEWMRESLQIFLSIMRGLTYLHAQSVAHLDLDIYNIAIDKEFVPRIIDFGSSQVMDHRGIVGQGYVGIKCKPVFVAPEVREHAKLQPPRPGFRGAHADLWSVGVVCVVWGFRGGPTYLTRNPKWRLEVFAHIDGNCDYDTCHMCQNFIMIPPLVGAVIKALLQRDPLRRPSAYEVTMALQENRELELFPSSGSASRRPNQDTSAMA